MVSTRSMSLFCSFHSEGCFNCYMAHIYSLVSGLTVRCLDNVDEEIKGFLFTRLETLVSILDRVIGFVMPEEDSVRRLHKACRLLLSQLETSKGHSIGVIGGMSHHLAKLVDHVSALILSMWSCYERLGTY